MMVHGAGLLCCLCPTAVGLGHGMFLSLGRQEEMECLRFGPRAPVARSGGQRSWYDDQKRLLVVIRPSPHPKQGQVYVSRAGEPASPLDPCFGA